MSTFFAYTEFERMRRECLSSIFVVMITLALVAGIMSFGFMSHDTGSPCAAAVATGMDCSMMSGTDLMFQHHLQGINQLTQAVFFSWASHGTLFLVIFALGFLLSTGSRGLVATSIRTRALLKRWRIRDKMATVTRRLLHWISLRNKSDAHRTLWVLESAMI